jgi:hypothetical protein
MFERHWVKTLTPHPMGMEGETGKFDFEGTMPRDVYEHTTSSSEKC